MLISLAVAVAVLAGCGGSGSDPPHTSDRQLAATLYGALRSLFVDFDRGDMAAVCGDLAPRARRDLERRLRGPCAATLAARLRRFERASGSSGGGPAVPDMMRVFGHPIAVRATTRTATAAFLPFGKRWIYHFAYDHGRWRVDERLTVDLTVTRGRLSTGAVSALALGGGPL